MTAHPWKVDEAHSGIHFAVRHLVIARVRGRFARWSASLVLDEQDLTRSTIDVTIDAASIETANPGRDADLRGPKFLDVDRFAALGFRSKHVERIDATQYRVHADLTIRDITREVVLDATLGGIGKDPFGMRRCGFSARTSIDRTEFGIVFDQILETGGVAVGHRIDIEIELEAVLAEQPTPLASPRAAQPTTGDRP